MSKELSRERREKFHATSLHMFMYLLPPIFTTKALVENKSYKGK